ncbi:MAG: GNAT family N-acetyltransferase [Acutalibacteraceae bacterium]
MNSVLRKWRMSDARDLAAALNNKKILNNLRDGLPFPYTEKDAEEYIAAMLSANENDTFAYAVTIDDRAVGSIGAFRQSNIHRQTAELGYYLAEEYWGRGIMTEAIRQLCGLIFEATDIIRIYAEPFAYNTGSRRALEKAGFTYEGTLKSNAVKNGRVLDMTMYALTKEPYIFRRLTTEEIPAALSLALEVFSEYEAPVYSEEGTEEFRRCLQDEKYLAGISYYGAFDGDMLIGEIGIRPKQRHICFFFVKGSYHRRGIGTKLFERLLCDIPCGTITLNSSPYGLPFYKALGFRTTDKEQTVNGIRFTPMEYPVNAE